MSTKTWEAKVQIKADKGFNGYIETKVTAPTMAQARSLLMAQYQIGSHQIGAIRESK